MKHFKLDDLVIFENDDLLILNKPAGISTLEDRLDDTNLLGLARKKFPDIQACHRLDKDTSGSIIFAKNPESYRLLSMQFEHRQVKKIYHTVVTGQTAFADTEINAPITIKNSGFVVVDHREGKTSTTFFTTLKNFSKWSLVECRPLSGRKHQIRIHLKHAKHPIVSDVDYGGEHVFLYDIKKKYAVSTGEAKPMIDRVALHAFSVEFKLPSGEDIKIEAPYPKDFAVLVKQLAKYAQA